MSTAYRLAFDVPVSLFRSIDDHHHDQSDVVVSFVDAVPSGREAQSDHQYLSFPGVASAWVDGGDRVAIHLEPGTDDRVVDLLLAGPIAGSLLHQRGHLVLHASAVRVGDRAVVFAGGSTWGKSTTAARLYLDGHACVADDVVPLRAIGGEVRTLPGYPAHKLWPDAVRALGLDADELQPIGLDGEKRLLAAGRGFRSEPLRVARIYVLTPGETTRVEHVEGHAAYVELLRHSYLARYLGQSGRQATHLRQAESILADVGIRRLVQGPLEELDRLTGVIEADLARDR